VTGAYVVTTMEELLSLKWNNHKSTFIHVLGILRDKQLYTDATLACEGKFYNAHKLVLSTCSDYFSAMLDRTNCKNPVIVLKDIRSEDLEALLDYMYLGEVNVRQSDLATLIKAAECLRVKGLAVPDDEPPPRKAKEPRRDASASSPPAKRKRRSDVDDGRDDVRNVRQDNHKPSPSIRSTNIQNLDNSPNNSESNSTNNASNMNIGNNLPSMNDSNAASSERVSKAEYSKETFNNSDDSVSAIPPVKVEVIDDNDVNTDNADSIAAGDSGSYLDNDDFKEEDPQELSSDLPEFLQQASGSFPQGFPGTSFQPDLWQGDGSNGNFAAATSMAYDNQNNTSAGDSKSFMFSLEHASNSQAKPAPVAATEQTLPGSSERCVQCGVCGARFTGSKRRFLLNRHAVIHTGAKPFRCPHCAHCTNRKENLQQHIFSRHYKAPNGAA